MEGGMLDLVESLPDEVAALLDPAKVGKALRHSDHGAFASRGYVYRGVSAARQDFYDGEHPPACGEHHKGLLSLRIEKLDAPDADSGVWLELPADEKALGWALLSVGEKTFDTCRIAEAKSIIPAFQYQLAGDEDIGKLNKLAKRLQKLQQEMPGDLMLMKYKAVLELEQYSDLDMALDIAANLGCYDFSPDVLSPDAYGEYVLQSAGIDTGDPAFCRFDFRGYGEGVLAALADYAGRQPGWRVAPDSFEGVRVSVTEAEGWFLLRMSLHDPLMPLNIESARAGGVVRILGELRPFLAQWPRLAAP